MTELFTIYSDVLPCLRRDNKVSGWSKSGVKLLHQSVVTFKALTKHLFGKYQQSERATQKLHIADHLFYAICDIAGME